MYTIKRLVALEGDPTVLHKELGAAITEANMRARAKHEDYAVLNDLGIVVCIVYDMPDCGVAMQLMKPLGEDSEPPYKKSTAAKRVDQFIAFICSAMVAALIVQAVVDTWMHK